MTPKEKAEDLLYSYYRIQSDTSCNETDINQAKKCAIIAIDEILTIFEDASDVFTDDRDLILNETAWNYWESVKSEILKL